MHSNVLSHLDCGNSILVNLPKSTVKPLQSIQNYAAKIICKRQKYNSSTEWPIQASLVTYTLKVHLQTDDYCVQNVKRAGTTILGEQTKL